MRELIKENAEKAIYDYRIYPRFGSFCDKMVPIYLYNNGKLIHHGWYVASAFGVKETFTFENRSDWESKLHKITSIYNRGNYNEETNTFYPDSEQIKLEPETIKEFLGRKIKTKKIAYSTIKRHFK